jgi:hypothetical protein
LKSKFGGGYQMEVKLAEDEGIEGGGRGGADADNAGAGDANAVRVAGLQAFVERLFPGAVLDEWHGCLFKYIIPKKVPPTRDGDELADSGAACLPAPTSLASIFGAVEAAKEELGIVEYSVSQSTLEQVFISIAKEQ